MIQSFDHLEVDTVRFDFDRAGGNLRNFCVRWQGQQPLFPLHTAPWVDADDTLPEQVGLVDRKLSGDFFCAPFGGALGPPNHGWTANGNWYPVDVPPVGDGTVTRRYRLQETVYGADVTKTLMICPGHPLLYQSHRFEGGSGHFPIAHHAMIRVPGGARLSFSEKQFGITPNTALETEPDRGHSMLAYPQTFTGLDQVRTDDGSTVDVSRYPFATAHEDIVVLAGSKSERIGWSAALAQQDGFLFFSVKDAVALPETLLWMSNGGRHFAPWSGRHDCVLGIEEAATCAHAYGKFLSTGEKSTHGLNDGLNLDGQDNRDIRYALGAIPAPEGWTQVTKILPARDKIVFTDISGDQIELPFAGSHFGL